MLPEFSRNTIYYIIWIMMALVVFLVLWADRIRDRGVSKKSKI